jgi:aldehyde dehydrogenase family 7 protein A1
MMQYKNPATGQVLCDVQLGSAHDYNNCVEAMAEERDRWQMLPMPVRGEIVRQIGDGLRKNKEALGSVLSLEMGKIKSEGLGEVQEFIDICDLACGLSRTIGGKVIPSERPEHMMIEQWNPLGNVGIISAFNFPNAVYGWNAAIALVTGNQILWKAAETSSLLAIATNKIVSDVLK